MASERFGHGEGDQIVRHRQEAGFLRSGPVLLISSAALGAVAMIATMELIASARAVRAMVEMAAAPGRATTEHGLELRASGPGGWDPRLARHNAASARGEDPRTSLPAAFVCGLS